MEELLAGLQFSHERGVVHRDIKPANVMLTSDGQVKIADFGIARIESSSMTQAGTMLGTPAYMSPEQFMGQTVDARTDIYSAGVVLYQMLTGERPFEGGMSAIMHKVLNVDPPRPSELSVTAPELIDAVVNRSHGQAARAALRLRPGIRPSAAGGTRGPGCPSSGDGQRCDDGRATTIRGSHGGDHHPCPGHDPGLGECRTAANPLNAASARCKVAQPGAHARRRIACAPRRRRRRLVLGGRQGTGARRDSGQPRAPAYSCTRYCRPAGSLACRGASNHARVRRH